MPDHMDTLHGRLNCPHRIHTIRIVPLHACGVAVDGEGAGRERRPALVERGGENSGA